MNKKNIKSTFIYFVGNVLSKIIVLLLLPIYTKHIDPYDMGNYDTSISIITFFSSLVYLDIGATILRYKLEKSQKNNNSITYGLIIFTMSSILYFTLCIVYGVFSDMKYYFWVILYGFLYSFEYAIGYCARAKNENFTYAISGVIYTIIIVSVNLLLILGLKLGYLSLYISFCAASIFSILFMSLKAKIWKDLFIVFKKGFKFDKPYFMDMLKFSIPLCINSVAFWLLSSSNKIIVDEMLGSNYTGYLSVANKFNQAVYLLSSCIQLTWQEVAFSFDNDSKEKIGEFYSKNFISYYKFILIGISMIITAISILLNLFPNFIDSAYEASINLIPIAIIGTGFSIINLFIGTVLLSFKKTKAISISMLIGGIVSVASCIGFIKLGWGVLSATISFALAYMATIIYRVATAKRIMNFKIKSYNLIWISAILFIATFVFIKFGLIYNIILLFFEVIFFLFVFKDVVIKILNTIFKRNKEQINE